MDLDTSPSSEIAGWVNPILQWYQVKARPLPWRETADPYAIWISEVMLQQTQVATVLPYYTRWMRELPNVHALAAAPPERVLKLWEGLGYYSRARNLQRASKEILQNHKGRFPSRFEDVLALPGVGRYTAGAICSIAFNQPTPILDGNVARVLARWFALTGDPRASKSAPKFWDIAETLVRGAKELEKFPRGLNHRQACSSLNQGLMELGALVCIPSNPKCPECPVASRCSAFQRNAVHLFPERVKRPATIRQHQAVFIARAKGRILLARRAEGKVNAGFYELPSVTFHKRSEISQSARKLGLRLLQNTPAARAAHTIMRYRILLEAYEAEPISSQVPRSQSLPDIPPILPEYKWRSLRNLEKLPLSSITRKILKIDGSTLNHL